MIDCPEGMIKHKIIRTGRIICKDKDKGFFYFPDVEIVMWGYETVSEKLSNLNTIDEEGYSHQFRITDKFFKEKIYHFLEDVEKTNIY